MKKLICLAVISVFILCSYGYAKEGDSGYEGGISSCQNLLTSKSSSQYEYQEVVFISGTPIEMKGTVTIKKKVTNGTETTTYTYDIKDDNKNTLKRTISLQTKITIKDKQAIKETTIYGKPTETIVIVNDAYSLTSYSLTKSSLSDIKPAIDFFAGDITARKVYTLKGTSDTVTVDLQSQFYGYNENWSDGEVQIVDYFIQSDSDDDTWSGTARVKASSTSTTEFKYVKNYPEEISFVGGYIQSQKVLNKLTYECEMPEFDQDGISTDRIITNKGKITIESFPNEKRLMTKDLPGIRGHWAEEDIEKMYSLEIYDQTPTIFLPNQYMSRGEFARALGKAINIAPPATTTKSKTTKVLSPYTDVATDDPNFLYIQQLTTREVLNGFDDGNFWPNETLTRAQAIAAFVRMLGLESMSQDDYPVTVFKDNDQIPKWALRSVYAAYKIGVVKGNDGYLNPNGYMTKAEAAAFLNRVIDYMRKGITKSYSDEILNY